MKDMTHNTKQAYEKISQIMHAAYDTADRDWLMKHTGALTKLEALQTFPAYERAAQYIHALLLENGFDSEYLEFPADGKTAYQDKCMPLAWDAAVGRLTVKTSPVAFRDPVIADFQKLPLHLVKHSVATPAGGILTQVVTESQVYAGTDCTGAMVLLEADTSPTSDSIAPLLDLGALGFISEYLPNPMDRPDDIYWANAATDAGGWHVRTEDRDFIGFCISPRNGRKLRQAATLGDVEVLVECDGHRYEGTLPAVTALIPGRQKREVWLLAHTCEPFFVDDAMGVISSIGVVKKLQELIGSGVLPPLEFSIRLVFAAEVYGFAAVAEHFGGCLRDRVLGSINMDMPFGGKFDQIRIFYAPLAVPFYGNFIMKMVAGVYDREFGAPKIQDMYLAYHDDMSLSDAAVGLPMVWALGEITGFHHNSSWNTDFFDEENYARVIGFYTAWTGLVACMNEVLIPVFAGVSAQMAQDFLNLEAQRETYIGEPEAKMAYLTEAMRAAVYNYRLAADLPEITTLADGLTAPETNGERVPESKWLAYADKLIPSRPCPGFPFDRIRIPREQRRPLPDGMLYGPFAFILSAMDGKKTLKRAILEASWECHKAMGEKSVKKYVDAVMYLSDWGYLTVENRAPIDKKMIMEKLREVGIQKGDVLLVHSGLSQVGHVEGGADTVLDALLEVLGEDGTLLMPAFTQPYVAYEGSLNKERDYRPLTKEFADRISTGVIPKTFLHRPGTKRSAHATQSWCGTGKMAEYCLSAHGFLDAPMSEDSPMAKALELGGKVLFFGVDINYNTFLHYLEDKSDAPFLANVFIKVEDGNGRAQTEVIRRHVPGHRCFYGENPREGKFYRKALEKGLQIKVAELGVGRLQMMELRQLHDIGMELFRENPLATLCDDPNCLYCSRFRKK